MSKNIRYEKCTRKVSGGKSATKVSARTTPRSTLNTVGGKVRIKVEK